ncbi:hypothetical protein ABCR94_13785 [Streptomyces sp. 21So2-11]|uniref:hypothetical protein n=1 Tax=Streptomyces sp. 21So2-11 TaxID=3144408 RepID=UPI00321B374E
MWHPKGGAHVDGMDLPPTGVVLALGVEGPYARPGRSGGYGHLRTQAHEAARLNREEMLDLVSMPGRFQVQ